MGHDIMTVCRTCGILSIFISWIRLQLTRAASTVRLCFERAPYRQWVYSFWIKTL